jgi:hypothetical protein
MTQSGHGFVRSAVYGPIVTSICSLSLVERQRCIRGVTNSLDAVTVGVEHECGIVIGVILRSKPRRTVVPPAGEKRSFMEFLHRRAAGCAEADMGAWDWSSHIAFACDRKFDPEGPRCSAVVRATGAEINDTDQSERS